MIRDLYFDNSMTTRPSEKAVSSMLSFFTEMWGVPAAPHQKGQELYPYLEESYEGIYALLGADPQDHFIFTSSGAEAINHLFLSTYFEVTAKTGKNQYITANIDEAPAIMSISRLEEMGCVGKMVDADQSGKITASAIADVITPRTALVSLSWVNGLTGVINPVGEIASLCQERGILLHLNATHVLGKLYYELEDIGADFLTFNGDHLHAPKGTGGLYVKKGTPIQPFIVGGIEQNGYRAGSYNIPGLIALGHAAQETMECLDLMGTEGARLKSLLESEIRDGYPEAKVLYQGEERVPHITAIAFPGIANEALLFALNRERVFASIGGGSFQQIALVLEGAGVPPELAQTALCFALSRETTDEQVEEGAKRIVRVAKQMRKTSEHLLLKEEGTKRV